MRDAVAVEHQGDAVGVAAAGSQAALAVGLNGGNRTLPHSDHHAEARATGWPVSAGGRWVCWGLAARVELWTYHCMYGRVK